jgi:hypothetical protein
MKTIIPTRGLASNVNTTKVSDLRYYNSYFNGSEDTNAFRVKGATNVVFNGCTFENFTRSNEASAGGRVLWLGGSSGADLDGGQKYLIDNLYIQGCTFINCHRPFVLQYARVKNIWFTDNTIIDNDAYVVNPETTPYRIITGMFQCVDTDLIGANINEGLFCERNTLIIRNGSIQDAINMNGVDSNGNALYNINDNLAVASPNALMPYQITGNADGHGAAYIVVGDGRGSRYVKVHRNRAVNCSNYFIQYVYRPTIGTSYCDIQDNWGYSPQRDILNKQASGVGLQIEVYDPNSICRGNRVWWIRYNGNPNHSYFETNLTNAPDYTLERRRKMERENVFGDSTLTPELILPSYLAQIA